MSDQIQPMRPRTRRVNPAEVGLRSDPSQPTAVGSASPPNEVAEPEPRAKGAYAVGFGRPPVSTRFKPGQSGNPKGRPKAAKSLGTIVREKLDAKVEIKVGGRLKKVATREVLVMRLLDQAMKGDLKSAATLARYDRAEPPEAPDEAAAGAPLSAEERDLLMAYVNANTMNSDKEA